MTFSKWLDTFVSEKGIEDSILEVEGSIGINIIPMEVITSEIKSAPTSEQNAIKTMLVKIDFLNGDVTDYFKHLARAIAI